MDEAIALALALTCRKRRTSKKKRTKWSKQWFRNRAKFGHSELLQELRNNEPDDYKNFLRMDGDCFNELLEMVEPHIKKKRHSYAQSHTSCRQTVINPPIFGNWEFISRPQIHDCYFTSSDWRNCDGHMQCSY
ncbi:hypothetical protein PoB_004475600 [Plakobranchus ocellatus]|uniref:Uncharacterized protein n=1 Tax=Plakobranchus ocellatus TaxID=259542 RepID=A0AAV4B4I0_9GAST|nr:hypothetical protein PoB_004475600 [Plakobranchus ocellatus]